MLCVFLLNNSKRVTDIKERLPDDRETANLRSAYEV